MKTIEDLRKFAKLNLSPSCFRNYEMFIEPTIKEWLFNPIDDWREVESNITQMVMITEKVFKGNMHILYYKEGSYLFRWDKIPCRDNWRLIKALKHNYNINWIKTAKIEKINGDKTIKLSTETNSLILILNDKNTRVNLKIDDGRTDEFIVKENGKKIEIYKEDDEGSKDAFYEEINWEDFKIIKEDWGFNKKIDHLYTKRILKDFSHRVLNEANEVRNKIHDPSIVAPFSEQDLTLFHIARVITEKFLLALIAEKSKAASDDSVNANIIYI
jgi:hypothetical protein